LRGPPVKKGGKNVEKGKNGLWEAVHGKVQGKNPRDGQGRANGRKSSGKKERMKEKKKELSGEEKIGCKAQKQ